MLSLSSRLMLPHGLVTQVAAHHVAAQRQRQPGAVLPPDAQVHDQLQALILKRQLALVDDEPGVEAARRHRTEDLVEGNYLVGESCPARAGAAPETPWSSCPARRSRELRSSSIVIGRRATTIGP